MDSGQKDFGHAYLDKSTIDFLCKQIRNLRGGMSKKNFSKKIGVSVGGLTNLESPDYGNMNLRVLLRIAKKLDVALVCKFVDYQTFFDSQDYSEEALNPKPYSPQMVNKIHDAAE